MVGKQDHPPTATYSSRVDNDPPPPPYQPAGYHVQEHIEGASADRGLTIPQASRADELQAKNVPSPNADRHLYTDAPDMYKQACHEYGNSSSSPYAPPPGPSQVYGGYAAPGNDVPGQAYARYITGPHSLCSVLADHRGVSVYASSPPVRSRYPFQLEDPYVDVDYAVRWLLVTVTVILHLIPLL